MKKTTFTLMTAIGALFTVTGILLPFVEIPLKAAGCTQACVQNDECQKSLVLPSCSCGSQSSGRMYSGNPTYGSTMGTMIATSKSVFCFASFPCEVDYTLPNHHCDSWNGCVADNLGNTCAMYLVGPAVNHFYLSCQSSECNEE